MMLSNRSHQTLLIGKLSQPFGVIQQALKIDIILRSIYVCLMSSTSTPKDVCTNVYDNNINNSLKFKYWTVVRKGEGNLMW